MRKTQPIVIEGAQITPHDRAVIRRWCGKSLPRDGDVTLKLTRDQFVALQDVKEMLGMGRAQSN